MRLNLCRLVFTGLLAFATAQTAIGGCLKPSEPDSDFTRAGPYRVVQGDAPRGYTLWYPADIASSPCEHPVVVWGNGNLIVGNQYRNTNRHIASYGFIVLASDESAGGGWGNGEPLAEGIRLMRARNNQRGPLQGKVSLISGAAGHSMGGVSTEKLAGYQDNLGAIVDIMGGHLGLVRDHAVPTLLLTGTTDFMRTFVRQAWSNNEGPTVYLEGRGVGHMGWERDQEYDAVAAAWFRCWLDDDKNACGLFMDDGCPRCKQSIWGDVRKKNL